MARPKAGYRKKDGTKVPGVTTPIGRFKDSGALLWWAFEQGKLAEQGIISSLYDKRDAAAEAGTLAHDLFENWILGRDDIDALKEGYSDEVIEKAMTGFTNAKEWFEGSRIQITKTEMALVSEQYSFGGTPDAIGIDAQGRAVLLDWKTSSGIYVDYIIQLAAYGQLCRECLGFNPAAYHCVRFSKEYADFEHRKFEHIDLAWEQFKLFLRAYEIDKQLKKRVK